MRYAPQEWEKERNGWRAVVQLNVVRSISLILRVLEAELNGDPVSEELQGEESELFIDDVADADVVRLTDWHQMLMIRLAPLRSVEVELKKRLGAADLPRAIRGPLRATPFDAPSTPPESSTGRRMVEVSVRSWQDILDPGAQKLQNVDLPADQDTIAATIAGCKDDMKSIWNDKMVRLALQRRKIRLPDSAGLYVV